MNYQLKVVTHRFLQFPNLCLIGEMYASSVDD